MDKFYTIEQEPVIGADGLIFFQPVVREKIVGISLKGEVIYNDIANPVINGVKVGYGDVANFAKSIESGGSVAFGVGSSTVGYRMLL